MVKFILLVLSSFPVWALAAVAPQKIFLGFGDDLSGAMGTEIVYDIKHIDDILSGPLGGSYWSSVLQGPFIHASNIRTFWSYLKLNLKEKDLFVQYSSSLAGPKGLAMGISFDEMRDAILDQRAKQILVFTTCDYSGALVESFNRKKAVWKDWMKHGRSLLVMSSSGVSEPSVSGPGTDPEEPSAQVGSAGSSFGWALWKALKGHADGFPSGTKDGNVTLEELVVFTKHRTFEMGGHTPMITGTYDANTVISKTSTL